MTNEYFNPYVEGAVPLSAYYADQHINNHPRIVAYGDAAAIQTDVIKNGVNYKEPLFYEVNGEMYDVHVAVHGDVATADTVLIKMMPWSDDPLRGFEMLRAGLIAGEVEHPGTIPTKESVAVVGVSLPGMGLTEYPLSRRQKSSLNGVDGSFEEIAKVQWLAFTDVVNAELQGAQTSKKLKDLKVILSGNSMGASQAVSMLATKPDNINLVGLGLLEPIGLVDEASNWPALKWRQLETIITHARTGGAHQKDYTAENSYNQYPNLGPSITLAKQVPFQLSTHVGSTVSAMANGGDIARIVNAIQEYELRDMPIHVVNGTESPISPTERLNHLSSALGGIATHLRLETLQGHTHAVQENLSNAQRIFRGFTLS